MQRRIVVTGAGVITSFGDLEETWRRVVAGESAIAPLPPEFALCPTQIGGVIPESSLEGWWSGAMRRVASKSTKPTKLALIAVKQALEQAKLLQDDGTLFPNLRKRTGVSIGTGVGASELISKVALDMAYAEATRDEQEMRRRMQQLIRNHFATAMIMLPDASAFQTSFAFKIQGPMDCSIKACATGAGNIRRAAMELLLGHANIMVAGGTESLYPVDVMSFNVFAKNGALSKRNHDPQGASRPFDQEHDGFVPSEGAGVLVLETLESAQQRGVPVLAELVGYGETSDAKGSTDPEQDSQERAMNMALDMADPDRDTPWLVKTHGTSTIAGDKSEASAVAGTLEEVPHAFVWAPKSELGHTLGASGGIEAALAILAIQQGVVPPTRNLVNLILEAKGLNIPRVATEADIRIALCNSFGFGGQNVCLVFKKWEGQ